MPVIGAAVASSLGPVGVLESSGVLLLPPRRPRVMAVAFSDVAGLCVALQGRLSAALAEAGVYEPERRRWLPHVTIGRARGPLGRDVPVVEVPPLSFVPPSVTLFRSLLQRGGAVYEAVQRWELAAAPANDGQ